MPLEDYKVLFSDLDDTLIRTATGKVFPEDPTDFRIRKDVLDAINKKLPAVQYILVCSNQGGIPEYTTAEEFETKAASVNLFITRYCGKAALSRYCPSLDKGDPMRKPNTGMLQDLFDTVNSFMEQCGEQKFEKSDCLMIGDASGKEGDFSDSDKMAAENFGIDYYDVEDFLKL